ncbi:hypothetical protein GCM10010178_05410 [Lentzea flava]|uniref:Uncharacterized protein n=1 Tax=Lentzea flava TaxID=103732 RepID=A0ABQ2UAD8_9PSEU|nr:GntP family permease [Lentzea flava]GGU16619.1 hypothetical protein GCM10010178_05410 [Lentzea flava]
MLAVGAGSLFFSHVNDAGFRLVKTLLSVVGLVLVPLVDLVIW